MAFQKLTASSSVKQLLLRSWKRAANDGSNAPDDYRPRTAPGVYVPTAMTLSSMWPNMKPFVIASASQFRPSPPISMDSEESAKDYNEIKEYGRWSAPNEPLIKPRPRDSGWSVLRPHITRSRENW